MRWRPSASPAYLPLCRKHGIVEEVAVTSAPAGLGVQPGMVDRAKAERMASSPGRCWAAADEAAAANSLERGPALHAAGPPVHRSEKRKRKAMEGNRRGAAASRREQAAPPLVEAVERNKLNELQLQSHCSNCGLQSGRRLPLMALPQSVELQPVSAIEDAAARETASPVESRREQSLEGSPQRQFSVASRSG